MFAARDTYNSSTVAVNSTFGRVSSVFSSSVDSEHNALLKSVADAGGAFDSAVSDAGDILFDLNQSLEEVIGSLMAAVNGHASAMAKRLGANTLTIQASHEASILSELSTHAESLVAYSQNEIAGLEKVVADSQGIAHDLDSQSEDILASVEVLGEG